MSAPLKDRALILRVTRFEERHQILSVLTEHSGRISLLARNSIHSKRFGGSLGILSLSTLEFTLPENRDLGHLTQAQCIESFEPLRQNWDVFVCATFFIELLQRVTPERETIPEIFRLLVNSLVTLSATAHTLERPQIQILAALFGLKVLQWSGSQPRLTSCQSCAVPAGAVTTSMPLRMTVAEAGWLCPDCTERGEAARVNQRVGTEFGHHDFGLSVQAIELSHTALNDPIRKSFVSALQSPALEQEGSVWLGWVLSLLRYHLPSLAESPLKSAESLLETRSIPPLPEGLLRQSPPDPAQAL